MQHNNPQANKGGAGGGSGSPQADPLEELEQQIQALNQQIQEIQSQINTDEGNLKSAEAGLENKKDKKKDLDARKTSLQRLVDGAKGDRTKIEQARQSAGGEAQAARQELENICQDLDDQLSEEYRQQVQQAISQVDDKIEELKASVEAKQGEVQSAEDGLAEAKAALAQAEADLQQAQGDLRGLPGRIQKWLAMVKKALGALKSAYDRGQAGEAYLLSGDLEAALAGLEPLLDPAYEQGLAEKLQEAWQAYGTAGDAVPPAEQALTARKDELAPIQADLKEYTDNRRQKIEDLIEAAQAAAAGAAVPAAAGR